MEIAIANAYYAGKSFIRKDLPMWIHQKADEILPSCWAGPFTIGWRRTV